MYLKCLLSSAVLLTSMAASALQAQTLSLDSCITLALDNNKSIQASRLQVEQYRHTRKAYLANFFPNISAQAADLYSNGSTEVGMDIATPVGAFMESRLEQVLPQIIKSGAFTNQQMQVMKDAITGFSGGGMSELNPTIDAKVGNVWGAAITLEQPVYMGGKITAAYRMSQLGERMAQLGATLSREEVIVRTNEAYALLLKANALHKVALDYDSLLSNLLRDVENALKHGMVSNNEVLKVRVKKNEALLQLRQADNGIRLARMNLCHQIGLPLLTEVNILPIEMRRTGIDAKASVEGRADYSYLELKSQLAAEKVRLERSEFLPSLGIGASFGYVNGMEMLGQRLLGDEPTYALVATLKVPIYHANEAQHKIRAARLAYERTLIEQQELVERMNLELQQAANNLDEGILEANLADANLAAAEENLRSSRHAYDNGLESLSDLLTAQTLWQKAYADQVNADANIYVLIAKYRKASGKL